MVTYYIADYSLLQRLKRKIPFDEILYRTFTLTFGICNEYFAPAEGRKKKDMAIYIKKKKSRFIRKIWFTYFLILRQNFPIFHKFGKIRRDFLMFIFFCSGLRCRYGPKPSDVKTVKFNFSMSGRRKKSLLRKELLLEPFLWWGGGTFCP